VVIGAMLLFSVYMLQVRIKVVTRRTASVRNWDAYLINLLGDYSAKLGREDIFKRTVRNESSHKIIDDNGVRVINFATSRNLSYQKYNVPSL
jgi:hypothetical protein